MDNWGVGMKEDGKTIPTASSAFEWIASHPKDPSNVFFTTDEAYGMGLPHLTSLEIKIESITDLR